MDANKFLDNIKPQAMKRIQSRLVLEAIVKAENIEVTDEDVTKEIEEMAKNYQMEADKVRELVTPQIDDMKMDLAVQKAVDLVASEAKEI